MSKPSKKRCSKVTTTKRLLWAVFIWVVICTQESFILAALNRDPIPAITIAWVTTGLGTFGVYLVRAYLEKKNLPPMPPSSCDTEQGDQSI